MLRAFDLAAAADSPRFPCTGRCTPLLVQRATSGEGDDRIQPRAADPALHRTDDGLFRQHRQHPVMLGVMDRSTGPERRYFARFMPAIGQVGRAGLALLVDWRHDALHESRNGFASMPWTFHQAHGRRRLTIAVSVLYVLRSTPQ